jgi:hypothetical protein
MASTASQRNQRHPLPADGAQQGSSAGRCAGTDSTLTRSTSVRNARNTESQHRLQKSSRILMSGPVRCDAYAIQVRFRADPHDSSAQRIPANRDSGFDAKPENTKLRFIVINGCAVMAVLECLVILLLNAWELVLNGNPKKRVGLVSTRRDVAFVMSECQMATAPDAVALTLTA